ncbi:MAG: histidinol dehydrogenase [Steroidobacteraceae bacterium]
MQVLLWNELTPRQREIALARPAMQGRAEMRDQVARIIAQVRAKGDRAVARFTVQFDNVELAQMEIDQEEIAAAAGQLQRDERDAIQRAIDNVTLFHEAQRRDDITVNIMPGVRCQSLVRPIENVGLYAPGGATPLPSTVIMLAVPARLAGCAVGILCTPPRADGSIHPALLYAAQHCGVTRIFRVGGAQAVAAMAYGTESVPRVDKIFGPGNAWVTEAKQQVANDPRGAAIDLPAGPSEVMVIADASVRAEFAAADLLAQAEHDASAQAIMVTTSRSIARMVVAELRNQVRRLSRRKILAASIRNLRIICVSDFGAAIDIANLYAPEHLIVQCREPEKWLPRLRNAGSVFLGEWTPEPIGDYCSGTNHVLPTYGYARNYSGLGLADFQRRMSVQTLTQKGLARLGPTAVTLAKIEGLDAHAQAVELRLARASNR